MNTTETTVVVGAGQAGAELALAMRQLHYEGRIVIVGEEPHLPYQRPPLSKGFLSGEVGIESLHIRPQHTYVKANIELLCGVTVNAINRSSKSLTLSDGGSLCYTKLALTTGGRARRLQCNGAERAEGMANFHYLRNINDVMSMRTVFDARMRLVIIGGGYVGLEVAAVAIKRGMLVTVLEAMPRVLARVTAPELSEFYAGVHRAAGVDLRTGVGVAGFEFDPSGDAVSAVLCTDGARIQTDFVIAGVGLMPNSELAEAAGLAVDNGILVDEFTRTSDLDIVAAGDCTNHPNSFLGRRVRLESVPNAIEQARAAAATLCGQMRAYDAIPWFWSDQYDLKLQMVGLSEGYDQLVMRGSPASRSFTAFYLKEGRIIATDSVCRPPEFMISKRLVANRAIIAPSQLADEAIPLKQLLATGEA